MAKKVTEDEAREFQRLYVKEGLSRDTISTKTGRTAKIISIHLKRLGVEMRSPGSRASSPRPAARRHGMSGHPHYYTWLGMMRRCYHPDRWEYKHYGGRGIEVFGPWHDPRVYIEYVENVLGPRPSPQHTIDRIDNDDNYKPGNIQWADKTTQNQKRDLTRNA